MSQSTFDSLLQKYLAGKCTEEEEQLVMEWYQTLIKGTDLRLSEEEKKAIESRLWQSIERNVGTTRPDTRRPVITGPALPFRRLYRMAAAACLAGLVIAGSWLGYRYLSGKQAVTTADNDRQAGYLRFANTSSVVKQLRLTDSTIIALQPGASIDYPDSLNGSAREVYLTGSAFFTVNHDPLRHFMVHVNGKLMTEVLGTSFNILDQPAVDRIEVQVMTGKVCVYPLAATSTGTGNKSPDRVILTPNKKVIFNAANNELVTALIGDPQPLWKQTTGIGKESEKENAAFQFEDQALSIVLDSLSRAYGITIITMDDTLGQRHFTGNISAYDLYKQLDIICLSTQSTYKVEGARIILQQKED